MSSQSVIHQCNNWIQAISEAVFSLKAIVDFHSNKWRDQVTFKTGLKPGGPVGIVLILNTKLVLPGEHGYGGWASGLQYVCDYSYRCLFI